MSTIPFIFTSNALHRTNFTRINVSRTRSSFRVLCQSQSKTEKTKITRRFSPLLESSLLSDNRYVASDEWKAVPDIWKTSADRFGDKIALIDPYHHHPSTIIYKQLEDAILDFSEGLRVIGVRPDEKIALFADNSCRWLIADQGMMASGAINVVRGSRSSIEELLQIYNHSESVALAVDNPEMFNRIAKAFNLKASMRFIILLWGEKSSLVNEGNKEMPIFTFTEVINLGQESRRSLFESQDARKHYVFEAIKSDDIATLVYTSGTTGNPKGVMLTHQNLLHQIKFYSDIVPAEVGDRFLSMLPPWHAYERACEYFIFSCGVDQVYTTVRNLKDNLGRYQPHYLISVQGRRSFNFKLGQPFTIDNGLMTPTMKVGRDRVMAQYRNQIENLYIQVNLPSISNGMLQIVKVRSKDQMENL